MTGMCKRRASKSMRLHKSSPLRLRRRISSAHSRGRSCYHTDVLELLKLNQFLIMT